MNICIATGTCILLFISHIINLKLHLGSEVESEFYLAVEYLIIGLVLAIVFLLAEYILSFAIFLYCRCL